VSRIALLLLRPTFVAKAGKQVDAGFAAFFLVGCARLLMWAILTSLTKHRG
jgi:hypothetical protein